MKYVSNYLMSITLVLSGLAHGGGDSSDGHSHGEAVKSDMAVDIAPRTSTQTDEFELVAVLEGKKLTLYLDRFTTNEPVADAEIEVESGTFKAVAVQVSPGVYSLPAEAFALPGKYPLAISVQAGDTADLLTATLDLAPPAAGVEYAPGWDKWAVWGASGALLLAGTGLVAVRRRKLNRKY